MVSIGKYCHCFICLNMKQPYFLISLLLFMGCEALLEENVAFPKNRTF